MEPYKTETAKGLPVLIVPDARALLAENTTLKHYIAETWRKSMQRDDIYKRHITLRNDAIWSRIERLLASPLTTVTLAVWPEGGSEGDGELFVVGWLVTGPGPTVHYAYVRERYRGAGVVKELLKTATEDGFFACTHWSEKLPSSGMFGRPINGPYFEYVGMDWVPQATSKGADAND